MWIYLESTNSAFNLDHVARLFVEATGTGAALKAELATGGSATPAAKTVMVAYFDSKADAQAALADLMQKREADVAVVRMG